MTSTPNKSKKNSVPRSVGTEVSGVTKLNIESPSSPVVPDIADPEPAVVDPLTEKIQQLQSEKPELYQQYLNAVKARKRVSILSDLTLRIG